MDPRDQTDTLARITALDKSLRETRAELAETREEIRELRSLLEQINKTLPVSSAVPTSATPHESMEAQPANDAVQSEAAAAQPAQISADDWEILKTEIQEQAQDKVESGSKYRVKLWGLALFNAFDVSGDVDNIDVPALAFPRYPGASRGSVGASLRQSIIGVTGTGPELLGAHTSADLQVDFFGGLPAGYSGGTSGVARLRLARIRFDWEHTSVVAGLDTPFFSPNSPTSFMSIAVPAFASAGNLWNWSPAVRIEHRFDTRVSQLKIEAGVMDPPSYVQFNSGFRQPSPGENSRQPVYAMRFSANGTSGDRPAAVGISGVYFPQRFSEFTTVSGWGGILDWRFPVFPRTELSGEFFGGKGLDSFGGVPVPLFAPQDYNQYIEAGAPVLEQATMLGGWSQLKFTINSRNEFNVAAGIGDRNAGDLARDAVLFPVLGSVSTRNQEFFVNYIFRPRSDLLLSPEYRRLRTYPLQGAPAIASQIGLAAGFLF